jgi:hypothetical protein
LPARSRAAAIRAAGERQGQRLLAQHMQPGAERGNREIRVKGIGRRNHHGIELAIQ